MNPFIANYRSGLVLLVFALSLSAAQAQTVTISDTAFAHFLRVKFPACMSGNLMDTTCADIVNATSVNCPSKGIKDLDGIQYFDNLEGLNCSSNPIQNFPSLPDLLRLNLKSCSLSSLPPLPSSLVSLDVSSNNFNSSVVLPAGLNCLNISNNYDMDSLPALSAGLDTLICQNMSHNFTRLNSLPSGLIALDCSNCPYITHVSALPSTLKMFYIGNTFFYQGMNFTYTSFPQLPAGMIDFESVNVTFPQQFISQFTSFPDSLERFRCIGCGLTSLPSVVPLTLRFFDVHDNQLTSLPSFDHFRQSNTRMDFISFGSNPLTCIPLMPELTPASTYFYWWGTQATCQPYDPWEADGHNSLMNELPVCNVFNNTNNCPGAPQWNIVGKVYLDQDSNCTYNVSEDGLKNIPMELWKGGNLIKQTVTDIYGHFVFDTDFDTYQVRIKTTGLPFNVHCPANNQLSTIISFNDSVETGMEFGLRCKSGFDLEARSIVTEQFRPGRLTRINVGAGEIAQFYGAQCAAGRSGSVIVNISGPVTFVGPAQGALIPTVMPGMLIYNIADFGAVNPTGDFDFVVRTDTSAQAVGQQVCFTVSVSPTVGDRNPSNNTTTHCSTVQPNPVPGPVGTSYDPNDKQVYPIGNIDTAQHWLTYTIRFQNTGTAAATFIHLDDTLDNNLDATTLQLLAYSHDVVVQTNLSALRFNFPEIYLPDSTADEPGSHGYVQFKVKLKDNLPLGTVISNDAAIYFDANPPVITNTVQTTIGLKFSGTVATESGTPVPTATVDITGDATDSEVVNAAGFYEFTSPKLGSFVITPTKNNDHFKANGVSTLDIIQIRKHVLGSSPLSSPYKMIAADVNGSNSVTVADINELRKFILGTDTTFSGKLWSFVPHDYVFPNPNNPFPYNEFRSYFDLNANQTNQNFIGVKLGDVSGNWNPSVAKTGAIGEVQFVMSDYQALRDDVIIIPVKVKDFKEIAGYQFTITWNAEVIELLETESRAIPGFYGRFDDKGMLTTSWSDATGSAVTLEDDAIAFELKFRVVGAPGTSTEIKIGSDITASEAYTNGLDLLDIKTLDGRVTVGDKTSSSFNPQSSSLHLQVQPNPFSHLTNITFIIPQSEEVQLEIYDVLMKEVKTFSGHYNAGTHRLQWNGENNSGEALPNGSYYVKLVVGEENIGEKVLLIR